MIKGQTTNSFSLLSDDEIYRQPSVPKTEPKTAPQTNVAKKVDTNVRKTNKPSTGTKNFVGRKNDNRKPRGIYLNLLFYPVGVMFAMELEVDNA